MNTNRLSIIGGSAVILVILVLGYMLGVSPKLSEAETASAQQQVVDTANISQEAQVAILRAKFAKIDVLRAESASLQVSIPPTLNSPDFVDQVKILADQAGAVVLAISLGEPQAMVLPAAPAAGSSPTPAAAVSPAAAYGTTLVGTLYYSTVSITIGGSSTSSFDFLNALQQGQRLFLSDGVQVATGGAQPGATISGYVLIVPSGTPAPTKPAG